MQISVQTVEDPNVNLNANHREVWIRDLDGYAVVMAGASEDAITAAMIAPDRRQILGLFPLDYQPRFLMRGSERRHERI